MQAMKSNPLVASEKTLLPGYGGLTKKKTGRGRAGVCKTQKPNFQWLFMWAKAGKIKQTRQGIYRKVVNARRHQDSRVNHSYSMATKNNGPAVPLKKNESDSFWGDTNSITETVGKKSSRLLQQ